MHVQLGLEVKVRRYGLRTVNVDGMVYLWFVT